MLDRRLAPLAVQPQRGGLLRFVALFRGAGHYVAMLVAIKHLDVFRALFLQVTEYVLAWRFVGAGAGR